jgi:hypothetical protein
MANLSGALALSDFRNDGRGERTNTLWGLAQEEGSIALPDLPLEPRSPRPLGSMADAIQCLGGETSIRTLRFDCAWDIPEACRPDNEGLVTERRDTGVPSGFSSRAERGPFLLGLLAG